MAETNAATDIGLLTTFGKVVSGNYTPFAEMTELNPPETTRDGPEFTHFGSPDGFREFKPGLADAGEVSLSYNLVAGLLDDDTIHDHLATRAVETWRIVFPNGAKLDVKAFATAHGRATPIDDRMTGSATFKVTGKPVLTPAA
ncbi:phage tail tube protein [Sphingobium sp. WCS2017Hpa-17]|uniref:phage tail tube protein n=1 Tax=Sphingobium sp. WCS2017Hpa-17 TaxID=3073638 RepID=UPI00288C0D9E|nr:phage tail tube protein [Sphingobium sp. WCS2017Hpa-17]